MIPLIAGNSPTSRTGDNQQLRPKGKVQRLAHRRVGCKLMAFETGDTQTV